MSVHFYDVETYPNFFCVTFKSLETHEVNQFVLFNKRNERKELFEFLKSTKSLIGFNNLHYDAPMLRYIYMNRELGINDLLEDLFDLSSKLINDEFKFDNIIRTLKWGKFSIKEIDLMKMRAFDKLGISLKQTAINLKWKRIQDLPLPYDHIVTEDEIKIILDYNLNDVLITEKFYERLRDPKNDVVGLREDLAVLYGIDLINASDSKMANLLLEDIYTRRSGKTISQLKDLRTKREEVALKDCIGNSIEFESNVLRRLKKEIESSVVRKVQSFAFKKEIEIAGVTYKMGSGGLHSEDKPAVFYETEKYIIKDCDVSSLYPNIIINNKITPEHLDENFVSILSSLTKERLSAKKSGQKAKAEGLKITVNSIFGKLNSETFWLEDAKAMLSTTISGQLYIFMLIEDLVMSGIKVISANTDGVVSLIERDKIDLYYSICKKWESQTNFELEYTDYEYYVRSSVNDYIVKKLDGKTKEKGMYVREIGLNKGYSYPVIPEVFHQYFINKIPIMQTLIAHKDILDFCVSQKTGKEFIMKMGDKLDVTQFTKEEKENYLSNNGWINFYAEDSWLKYDEDDKSVTDLDSAFKRAMGEYINVDELQKNNRFFISNNGKYIYKENKKNGKKIGLFVGKKITLLNDFDEHRRFDSYDIDYDFYANEAQKYIDDIESVEPNSLPSSFVDIDNDEYVVDVNEKDKSELLLKFNGMKGLSDKVLNNLLFLGTDHTENSFVDFLVLAENNSMVASKFEDLIKIGYFSQYGSGKKLLSFFQEFRKGKSKYTNKLSEKSKVKRLEELREIWSNLPEEEFSVMEKIANELTILGKIESKFTNLKERYGFVIDLDTRNSPKAKLQSLRNGNIETFKIQKAVFSKNEFSTGQIILLPDGCIEKKQASKPTGRFLENGKPEFEKIDKEEYWIKNYSIVNKL